VRIKPDKARITHKEKTYEIDVENPTFTKEGDNFYFIDIKKGQICFSTNEKTNSNQFEAMNDIIDKEIINQLTTDLIEKPSWSDRIIIAVMGLSIGLFIGYIFSDILGGFL
jgi:predicted restriction endonuclease